MKRLQVFESHWTASEDVVQHLNLRWVPLNIDCKSTKQDLVSHVEWAGTCMGSVLFVVEVPFSG